jgi:hypothetical protein
VKGAVLTVIAAVAILSGVVGLFAWSPWESKERQRELAWVEEYLVWSAAMDERLFDGQVTVRSCEARFEKRVGQAPTRLRPV